MLTGFLSCVGLWKIFTFNAMYYYNVSSYLYMCICIFIEICHYFCNQKKINVSVAWSLESPVTKVQKASPNPLTLPENKTLLKLERGCRLTKGRPLMETPLAFRVYKPL